MLLGALWGVPGGFQGVARRSLGCSGGFPGCCLLGALWGVPGGLQGVARVFWAVYRELLGALWGVPGGFQGVARRSLGCSGWFPGCC